ncbi:MAG: hypothetical protein IPJ33_20750 [Gammaproteobacteria bacterium]|jgi:hypothetical protein|nr:hypothetical protein [Gammaproteobacteria bacterium]MBK6584588.1 hypothetical protein [Gammaproteobacteria bacterium]MBK7519903.1 hypothetical protein [Gammaproteobacteria bacterium]MBK7730854.1 hypothetical protein [Gammaproteobacteria bacterium]MBK8306371.1 hypothetical protein [Gammaproteobacteria bacterium]
MQLQLAFELRSPSCGASHRERYAGGVLLLNPLLGGIAPREAWKMLRLFEREVLPHLPVQ